MKRHCQFTVKRFEVDYSNMGLELTTSCLPLRHPIPPNNKYTAANYASICSERDLTFLSFQLHLVTLA